MDLRALAAALAPLSPADRAARLNDLRVGFDRALGLTWVSASSTEVVARLVITEAHLQPYGLVHGGVWCGLAEAACSVGATLAALADGRLCVGVENRTRFHRAARAGAVVTVTATPAGDGAWAAVLTDDAGRQCASATVLTHALAPGASVGGAAVSLPEDYAG